MAFNTAACCVVLCRTIPHRSSPHRDVACHGVWTATWRNLAVTKDEIQKSLREMVADLQSLKRAAGGPPKSLHY